MERFYAVIEKINHAGNILGSIFLTGVMLVIISNIVVRLFGSVIQGSNEIVELMQAVVVSTAIVYTTLRNKHTMVDFILDRFKPKSRSIINIFTSLLSIIIWSLVAWTGNQYAWKMWNKGEMSETLQIPYLPFRCIWVIASILLVVIFLLNLIDSFKRTMKK